MPNDPQLRASDDDRDRAASLLREHHAAGRLTVEEFQERLDGVFEAKTVAQLEGLMADLPGIDLYRLPEATMRQTSQPLVPVPSHGRLSPAWRGAWGSWASVSMVVFVIWLLTSLHGGTHDFWFLWLAAPWGAILLSRWVFGGSPGNPHVHGPPRGSSVYGPDGSPVPELRVERQAERDARHTARDAARRDRHGRGDHHPRDL